MSGEHGDGLARSVWNAKLFGPEVYGCFEAVKRAFDPDNRMNPGKVVADPTRATTSGWAPTTTRSSPTRPCSTSRPGRVRPRRRDVLGRGRLPQDGTGTMCPSYMVTRDEMHTTRGRANVLRLVMTGELRRRDGLANETLPEALDLCLQCKACKSECPSNVDMAKLKAEVLHQRYQDGRYRSALLMGQSTGSTRSARPRPRGQLGAPAAGRQVAAGAGQVDRRRSLAT